MQTPEATDRELDEVCAAVAADVLAWDDEDTDPALTLFAAKTFLRQEQRKMSETELERLLREAALCSGELPGISEAQLIPESDTAAIEENVRKLNAEAEAQEAARDLAGTEEIGDFVDELYASPLVARANSRRAKLFDILCSAVNECAFEDEEGGDGGGIWERMHKDLTAAELFLFFEPDDARFRKAIRVAFERAVGCGLDLEKLASEIRRQTDARSRAKFEVVHDTKRDDAFVKACQSAGVSESEARAMLLRASRWGKRTKLGASMSAEDEQFYR